MGESFEGDCRNADPVLQEKVPRCSKTVVQRKGLHFIALPFTNNGDIVHLGSFHSDGHLDLSEIRGGGAVGLSFHHAFGRFGCSNPIRDRPKS